jgi:predicted nucleic acid-binding protein
MYLYLDSCALNRPWDDQAHPKILEETEAIYGILGYVFDAPATEHGRLVTYGHVEDWGLYATKALIDEIQAGRAKDPDRAARILQFLEDHKVEDIPVDKRVEDRAKKLQADPFRLKPKDALHAACAEAARADFIVTTDDRFLKRYRECRDDGAVVIVNPVDLYRELLGEFGPNTFLMSPKPL